MITLSTMIVQRYRSTFVVRFHSTLKNSKPRIYLTVSYSQKDTVKGLGGKWDAVQKKWYIDDMSLIPHVKPWHRVYVSQPPNFQPTDTQKQFHWDALQSKWYTLGYDLDTDIANASSNLTVASRKKKVNSILGSAVVQKPLDMNSRIIFFDLETNGLPSKANKTNPFDCCRIVQLSYLLCNLGSLKAPLSEDAAAERPEAEEAVIRADGFDIPNAHIHGITLERSMAEGRPFSEVMAQIAPVFKQAQYIVAHNADGFDLPVFKSELRRYGETELLAHVETMAVVCTMTRTAGLLQLLNRIGRPKNPNLRELFHFATGGEEIAGQHNAKYDVMNLHRAVRALARRDLMPLEQLFASPAGTKEEGDLTLAAAAEAASVSSTASAAADTSVPPVAASAPGEAAVQASAAGAVASAEETAAADARVEVEAEGGLVPDTPTGSECESGASEGPPAAAK